MRVSIYSYEPAVLPRLLGIEDLPLELQAKFTLLTDREMLFDELKRNLHRHRNMLLRLYNHKPGKSGVDTMEQPQEAADASREATRQELSTKIEKEYQRALSALDDKISIEQEMKEAIEQYLRAIEYELGKFEPVQSVLQPPKHQ